MNIAVTPANSNYSKCLILVGGSGDTSVGFAPLVKGIREQIPDMAICTFSFTPYSSEESVLDLQSRELEQVITQLTRDYKFSEISLFSTSMGAYATIKLLSIKKYSNLISKVIFFDPADYYLSAKFGDSSDVTWSGSQAYEPTKEVVSNELKDVSGKVKISVVHLTLRNYGASGYLQKEYRDRGEDNPNGYPRLCTTMVKSLYSKIPLANRGEYIEVSDVPHAILRDGNIHANLVKTVNVIANSV